MKSERLVTDIVCDECGHASEVTGHSAMGEAWTVVPRGWSIVWTHDAGEHHLCCLGCVRKFAAKKRKDETP